MKHKRLYRKVIEARGKQRQVDKCIEECSELILELQKFRYGHSTCEKVCGEIADVQITIDQMKLIYGQKAYKECFVFKSNRLKRRLKKFVKHKEMGRRKEDKK